MSYTCLPIISCVDNIWSTVEASPMDISNVIVQIIYFISFLYENCSIPYVLGCRCTFIYSQEASFITQIKCPHILCQKLLHQIECWIIIGSKAEAVDHVHTDIFMVHSSSPHPLWGFERTKKIQKREKFLCNQSKIPTNWVFFSWILGLPSLFFYFWPLFHSPKIDLKVSKFRQTLCQHHQHTEEKKGVWRKSNNNKKLYLHKMLSGLW